MIRKIYVLVLALFSICSGCSSDKDIIMTVNGPIPASEAGIFLTHEHILVDFSGADKIIPGSWDKTKVLEKAMPFLNQAKDFGTKTFVECTPAYLGRDPYLLKFISVTSGLNILTNTGYYGAANDKYLPKQAYDESATELAGRWVTEWRFGIEESLAKPGFIKIGVAPGPLSELHKKLITAAAITHLHSGLTIASHTGPAIPAFEQLEILKQNGVAPEAFIWVHAQSEKDLSNHVKAAKMGAWVSFDGLSDKNVEDYVKMIINMKENKVLNKVLLSHDAGWFDPGKEDGGTYRGYNTLFEKLIPRLEQEKFSKREIYKLLVSNPARAFTIKIHKLQ
jgi:phosphotriesterase-related protein